MRDLLEFPQLRDHSQHSFPPRLYMAAQIYGLPLWRHIEGRLMEAIMNTRGIFALSDVCVTFENERNVIMTPSSIRNTSAKHPLVCFQGYFGVRQCFTTGGTYYNRSGPNTFLRQIRPAVVLAPILSIKLCNVETHVRVTLLYLLSSKVVHEIGAYGMPWQAKRKLRLCFGCASLVFYQHRHDRPNYAYLRTKQVIHFKVLFHLSHFEVLSSEAFRDPYHS